MCELCGTEEQQQQGRKHMEEIAELCDLTRRYYLGLASGMIKPHSDECQRRIIVVKSLVRQIFEDAL